MIVIRRNIGRPLTVPMREQIALLVHAGKSRRTVAAELGLCKRTVDKYAGVKISLQV